MAKTLSDYVMSVKKPKTYRIKFAFDITKEMMEKIKSVLAKYEPELISKVKTLILQKNPLDFPNIENVAVNYIDAVLMYSASPMLLKEEIRSRLLVSDSYVVVRELDKDPYESELRVMNEFELVKNKDKYVSKLSDGTYKSDASEVDADSLSGNKYNDTMIKTIEDSEKTADANNRKGYVFDLPIKKMIGDIPTENFNDDIKKNVSRMPTLAPVMKVNK